MDMFPPFDLQDSSMSIDHKFAEAVHSDILGNLDMDWKKSLFEEFCSEDASRGLSMISSELPQESELTDESYHDLMVREAQELAQEAQSYTKTEEVKECILLRENDFPVRIKKGLLKYARPNAKKNNKKARVFKEICRVAIDDGDVRLSRIKENPEVKRMLDSSRQVEIHMLKRSDGVIENVDESRGVYRLTPLGKRLAKVYCL